jgi:hypothetical protein
MGAPTTFFKILKRSHIDWAISKNFGTLGMPPNEPPAAK